jgi:hypothetical protein
MRSKINPWDEYAKDLKAWEHKAEQAQFARTALPVAVVVERKPFEWTRNFEGKNYCEWMAPAKQ